MLFPGKTLSLIFALFFAVGHLTGQSQSSTPASRPDTTVRFFGVPLAFYTPDTRWGGGVAGILTFRGRPLRSSVSFSVAYTQRRQILLWFPFQWYSPKGQWRAYGEVGWYRYLYQYFGIGNRYPFDYLETYTAQYPRLRLTALRQTNLRYNWGIRYGLDDYHIVEKDPQGEIASNKIPGARGGFSSSIGPVWLFDNRDNPFFPRQGWLVEVAVFGEHRLTGSDFTYLRYTLDAARYVSFGKYNVLAMQVLAQFTNGQSPFFLLPQIGGSRLLRGYPAGKFRDQHLLIVQGEGRFPLIWRFKSVLFCGVGSVFGSPGERVRWRPNGGLGVRFEFDRKQHIHLRADYGFGDGVSGFYLTVGEAL